MSGQNLDPWVVLFTVNNSEAAKVPVQPKAETGEKVEEGKPKAEPKVTTEEGKEEVSEEEVTPSKQRLDEQIDGIIKKVPVKKQLELTVTQVKI